jgi:hypothetical protein
MLLRIAGIHISISSADPAAIPYVAGSAGARFFVDDGDEAADLHLTLELVTELPARRGDLVFDSGAVWSTFDDGGGGLRVECHSPSFGAAPYKVAFFDRDFTTGRVLLRDDVFRDGTLGALEYPLDELMVSHLLARQRGVELHCSGIITGDGRGRLFVGQSGAGKTTTARLWMASEEIEIVSDDRVIVRNLGGEWRMFGTPWHGEAQLSTPGSAPLGHIYLLQQAPRTRVVDIAPAEAAARLFACTFPIFYQAEAIGFTLRCIDELVNAVPVHLLEFTPDASVVEAAR